MNYEHGWSRAASVNQFLRTKQNKCTLAFTCLNRVDVIALPDVFCDIKKWVNMSLMDIESTFLLRLLDYFFISFHTLLIFFNLFGWIWRKTRRWNLLTLTLTGLSWFGLGLCYGFGYCPLTDWHWVVRIKLGDDDLPLSYIKFLIDHLTSLDVNAHVVDLATVVCFAAAVLASLIVNIRDWWVAHKNQN